MEDLEKNEIQDAQIIEVDDSKKDKNKSYRTEIILILIIGLLLGIMIKAESLKKISIGFSDYRVTGGAQEYDLDEIEKKLIEDSEKEQAEAASESANQAEPTAENGSINENE